MSKYLDYPPVWALAAFIVGWAIAYLVPVWRFDLPLWSVIAVAATGAGLVVWSALYFLLKKTPIEPRKTPNSLILAGPYRINRNPIYTGMTIMLVGCALWVGDIVAFLPVLAYPVVITRRFVEGEEQSLRDAFPEDAEKYFSRSRRW